MENIGTRIKNLRKKSGLTQEALASKIGIQRASVASYEVGKTKPSHKNLEKISKILNVSMEYLVNGSTETPVPKSANFVSLLGKEIEIEPRKYDIERNLIPIHSSLSSKNMYAIKITSSEMKPTIPIGSIAFCLFDPIQAYENNQIVHYKYKDKIGIRRIKVDQKTKDIVLAPDDVKNHEIIVIDRKNLTDLKISKLKGFNFIF